MSIREILAITQLPVEPEILLAKSIIGLYSNLLQKVIAICEEEKLDLKELGAFNLKNNEWVIALTQIYENCYRTEQWKTFEGNMLE